MGGGEAKGATKTREGRQRRQRRRTIRTECVTSLMLVGVRARVRAYVRHGRVYVLGRYLLLGVRRAVLRCGGKRQASGSGSAVSAPNGRDDELIDGALLLVVCIRTYRPFRPHCGNASAFDGGNRDNIRHAGEKERGRWGVI